MGQSFSTIKQFFDSVNRVEEKNPTRKVRRLVSSSTAHGGSSQTRKEQILNLFTPDTAEFGLYGMFYNSGEPVQPWLLTHLGDQKYLRVPLTPSGGPGSEPWSYNVTTLGEFHVVQVYQSSGPDTGGISVTLSGTWTTGVASTPAFDGQYAYTSTTGDYYEWTTPSNTTMVGQRGNHLTDGGLCKVEINGDTTLATNLPTAQDLVDAGTIASLGTLNATDRILDCSEADDYDYQGMSGNADVAVMFANDLAPGIHTVRVTVTGEKATASTGNRMYYSGVIYTTLATNLSSENVFGMGSNDFNGITNQHGGGLYYIDRISPSTASVTEYAFHLLPTGATDDVSWIGNGHGYEEEVSTTYSVNSQSQTLTALTCYTGNNIIVTRTSELFHPDIGAGATAIGDATVQYKPAAGGITVNVSIDWLTDGTGEGGYMHMFPLDNSMSRGNSIPNTSDINMDGDVGGFPINTITDLVYTWQHDGKYAAALYIPDLDASNNNFQYCTTDFFSYQDRDTGSMNKMYLNIGDAVPFSNGKTWNAEAHYKVGMFNEGADTLFSTTL